MKPLKILLGNNTLSLLAGSETHTLTLALQLKEMGHFVACYAPELGIISDMLREKGIKSYSDISIGGVKRFTYVLEESVDHDYDVIISNHHHIVDYLRGKFPNKPIISTIHGILHTMEMEGGKIEKAPEHPALDSGVNQFVAVSEEVRDMLKSEYGIDSVIVRNFFDLKQFKANREASPGKPKQFLLNTNYAGLEDPEVKVVREVAKHYGARFTAVGMNFVQSTNMIQAIEDADIVFGMGRSVLEGVAAGRLGIVHGRWGTGGVIRETTIDEIRAQNFSGRNSNGKTWTKEEFIDAIDRFYNPETIEWGRNYMAREHNVMLAAEQYVRMARELTGQLFVRPSSSTPSAVASDTRPFKLAA